ncbi:MAG: hypothetical protein HC927_07790 [Deltaproteobacteria bacterium]|nr:hypothetical protein [Deltaproteobacteria bacterium]
MKVHDMKIRNHKLESILSATTLTASMLCGGLLLTSPSEVHAAEKRVLAAGNCVPRAAGSFDSNGDPSGWSWSSYDSDVHHYSGKVWLAGGSSATCAIPSDTALNHADVVLANVHLRHVEADCTGSVPVVKAASISYASGTYVEGSGADYSNSGCNYTFTVDSSGELYGWTYSSSYYPMVTVTAGVGEPVFIHGLWMHD